jgi:outer membrane immunogenic protein
MKKTIIALASAAAVLGMAAPAYADEGRVEARGGVYWTKGYSHATAGAAAGYDWSLGQGGFIGAEVSGDKVLDNGTRVSLGVSARGGAQLAGGAKLYAVGGYNTKPCKFCEDAWSLGAGAELPFGTNLYGKVEYRHFFVSNGFSDANVALLGLGVKF